MALREISTDGRHSVEVGRAVEVKRGEVLVLEECAAQMLSATKNKRVGWLLVYLRAHKESHRIISGIMSRSHAN